jgi:hypothetical protein
MARSKAAGGCGNHYPARRICGALSISRRAAPSFAWALSQFTRQLGASRGSVRKVPQVDDNKAPRDLQEAADYYLTPRRQHPNAQNKMLMSGLGAWVGFDAFDLVDPLVNQPLLIMRAQTRVRADEAKSCTPSLQARRCSISFEALRTLISTAADRGEAQPVVPGQTGAGQYRIIDAGRRVSDEPFGSARVEGEELPSHSEVSVSASPQLRRPNLRWRRPRVPAGC